MKTNITKQLILGTIISFGLFTAANAQSTAYDDQGYNDQSTYSQPQQYNQPQQDDQQQYNQPQQYSQQQYSQQQYQQPQQYQQSAPVADGQQFYYYPNANVYYNVNSGLYDYCNNGAWLSVNVLPSNIYLGARYSVYHRGPQVWLDNAIHMRNYRVGYRSAYRQPAIAYNNFRNDDFRGGMVRRDVVRRDDFGRDNFRGNTSRGGGRGFDRGNASRGGRGFDNRGGRR